MDTSNQAEKNNTAPVVTSLLKLKPIPPKKPFHARKGKAGWLALYMGKDFLKEVAIVAKCEDVSFVKWCAAALTNALLDSREKLGVTDRMMFMLTRREIAAMSERLKLIRERLPGPGMLNYREN